MNYFLEEQFKKDVYAYADVLLYLVAVEKDDTVLISCDFDHEALVYALTEQAYKKGAKHVDVQIQSALMNAHRAKYSTQKHLDYLPESSIARMKECCDNKTCIISIRSPADPKISDDVPSDALAHIHKVVREKQEEFHKAIISDSLTWIVSSFPTIGWAKNVYPTLEPREGTLQLWEVVKKVLRLDTNNPVEAWQLHQETLLARRKYLNAKKYKGLRFVGEGTNLYVGLHERSVWLGGRHESENKKIFQANVPTEEVYTSPDCRFTEGEVKIQRGLTVFGKIVEGITMKFEAGKVVNVSATKNEDVLIKYLDAHERNRYLGEIALVDIHSLVWKSNLMFNSILYDENAGVHFALGTAYTTGYGYKASDKIPSSDELIKMGCNSSNFHIDFTMGYEGLDVYGVHSNDTEEPIMQKGEFVVSDMKAK